MKNQEAGSESFKEGPNPIKMPVMMAIFDVLGFSTRLRRDGLDSMVSLYQDMVKRVIAKEPITCIGDRDVGDGTRCPVLYSADIRYAYFSDTILLWMPLEQLFAGPFVQRCADLVCEALSTGVPLRGAIALGDAVMHKATGMYLGEPIIDAHDLEEAQEWIGVAFARSGTWIHFIAELNPIQIIEYEIPVNEEKEVLCTPLALLKRLLCPRKSKRKEALCTPLALDWPRRWRDTREQSLSDILSQMNTSKKHARYYENTIAFARHSEAHHDWHNQPDEINAFKYLRMVKRDEIIAQQLRPADADKPRG